MKRLVRRTAAAFVIIVTFASLFQQAQQACAATYWLQTIAVPYPFDPYEGEIKVETLDAEMGIYVVLDTPDDWAALQALNAADSAVYAGQNSVLMLNGPDSGEAPYAYGPDDLWLEILEMNRTNQTASLILHRPAALTNAIYDLYFRTNLNLEPGSTFNSQWRRIRRVAPLQTSLFVTNLPLEQGYFLVGPSTNAIRPGFTNDFLIRNDDNHTGEGQFGTLLTNLLANIGFSINFYGNSRTNLFVNNNGNVTFDSRFDSYVPAPLNQLNARIIAPFWADVDTRNTNSDLVRYGTNIVDQHSAFGVNWVDVGYYSVHVDRLLSCQMVLIDRSDIASGDFDLEFNYDKVEWEYGDAGVYASRVGFSDTVSTNSYELPGSGILGQFLDSNPSTGLIYNTLNSPVSGRYVFFFRNGRPLQPLP